MDAQRFDWIADPHAEAGTRRGALRAATPDAVTAFGLTPREQEVLHHLARRATDREIAEDLSISSRTVMHHVSHVLDKLRVANRREAGFLAAQHDLV